MATAGRARIPTTRTTRPRTASGSTRPPATATTTSSTTASRTSTTSISPRTRSSCCITCATPRATASRATPSRRSRPPSSARRTTPPASSARRRRAVIADGHMGAAYYLRALFTTNQSIVSLWRNAPNYNGNEFSFASTPQLGADRVHGPGLADEELLPLARPEADADDPRCHRRRGRHRRRPGNVRRARAAPRSARSAPSCSPTRPASVAGALDRRDPPEARLAAQLDRPGRRRRVRGGGSRRRVDHRLRPRDPADPARQRSARRGHRRRGCRRPSPRTATTLRHDRPVRAASRRPSTGRCASPRATARSSARRAAPARSRSSRGPAWSTAPPWRTAATRTRSAARTPGRTRRSRSPDPARSRSTRRRPALSDVAQAADALPWFSPNGDGSRDTFALKASTNESGKIEVGVRNDGGDADPHLLRRPCPRAPSRSRGTVATTTAPSSPTARTTSASCRSTRVANRGTSETVSVRSVALLGAVKTSRTVFYPQDRDALGSTSVLSFTINAPGDRDLDDPERGRRRGRHAHRRRRPRRGHALVHVQWPDAGRRAAADWEVHVARDRDRRRRHGQPERRASR